MITVGPLAAADRAAWEQLFRGYTAFYQEEHPQSMYDRAWAEFQADERMHALGAWLDGALVGIVHFFPHLRTTGTDVCYLEDLFTAPQARGHGVGRALISAVRGVVRRAGAWPGVLADAPDQRDRPGAVRQGGGQRGLHRVRDGPGRLRAGQARGCQPGQRPA